MAYGSKKDGDRQIALCHMEIKNQKSFQVTIKQTPLFVQLDSSLDTENDDRHFGDWEDL